MSTIGHTPAEVIGSSASDNTSDDLRHLPPALHRNHVPAALAAHRATAAERRLPALDGLRGLAVLAVLFCHFTPFGVPDLQYAHFHLGVVLLKVSNWGAWGVDLFFVLSGFLITRILLDARTGEGYFRNFYARRMLRIFPTYFLALAFGLYLVPWIIPGARAEQGALLQHQAWLWLYLMNIPPFSSFAYYNAYVKFVHLWSLAIEEHFYLFWPMVVFFLSARRLAAACVVIIAGAAALRTVLQSHELMSPGAIHVFTLCRIDDLAMGALLTLIYPWSAGRPGVVTVARYLFAGSGVVCLSIGLKHFSKGLAPLDYTVLGVFFTSLIFLVLHLSPSTFMGRMLTAKPLRTVGKYSYAMYVYHFILLESWAKLVNPHTLIVLTHSALVGTLLFIGISTAATILLGAVSWHLIESPILSFKKYFQYGRHNAAAQRGAEPA